MKTGCLLLAALTATFALCAGGTARASDASDELCVKDAQTRYEIARMRDQGSGLAEVTEYAHAQFAMDGPVNADFLKQIDHNIRMIYESDRTPQEAAASFRRICLQGHP